MVKLNLGCGIDYRDGWINVDNQSMASCRVDVDADIFDYNCEPESVDHILLSHVAMYIRPDEMYQLLKRCHRWLRVGGTLEIETIDLKRVMQIAIDEPNPEKAHDYGMQNIFGTEETGPHRWGWSYEKLITRLSMAGFVGSVIYAKGDKKPERDFKLIAIK